MTAAQFDYVATLPRAPRFSISRTTAGMLRDRSEAERHRLGPRRIERIRTRTTMDETERHRLVVIGNDLTITHAMCVDVINIIVIRSINLQLNTTYRNLLNYLQLNTTQNIVYTIAHTKTIHQNLPKF